MCAQLASYLASCVDSVQKHLDGIASDLDERREDFDQDSAARSSTHYCTLQVVRFHFSRELALWSLGFLCSKWTFLMALLGILPFCATKYLNALQVLKVEG